MAFEAFGVGLGTTAFVAFLANNSNLRYTATQYALLTSALVWAGKFLKGFSGAWVQGLVTPGRDLTHAYALFYLYAAATGVPALLVLIWLAWTRRKPVQPAASADGASALTS